MKTVYLVRHGQSEGNVAEVYQTIDSPLTEEGTRQAKIIAERCSRLPIDVIISSTQLRARSTASVIAEKTGHAIEFSDLFRERRKPTALSGKSFSDPDAQKINAVWLRSLMGSGSRVEDGENFDDLMARAESALEYLINRPEKHLLVVTHGFFMRYLVSSAIYGKQLNGGIFEPIARCLVMENTGITVLRHGTSNQRESWGEAGPWQFWIWNDHAHLG